MGDGPLVSVLMPVLRADPAYLRTAILSLQTQTLANWELVIVEEPSPQPAGPVVAEFADPRIRHFFHAERTSLSDQLNRGLEHARAELVARFDADDVCEPDRLARQAEWLQQHPEVAVVGTQLTAIDPAGRVRGWRRYPLDHETIVRALPRYNAIAHPSVMYRRQVVLDAGAYTYRDYPAEDYDLWCRLARGGVRFANLPESLVRYRIHPAGQKTEKLRAMIRGTLDVKCRHWQGRMDLGARLRMQAERTLLWLPAPLVLRLFTWTQYGGRPPSKVIDRSKESGARS